MILLRNLVLAFALLVAGFVSANAASATLYVDIGGCQTNSATRCSGTTDSASATVGAAGATITCSATAGPSSAPGCSLSGSPSLAGIAVDGSQAIFVNCATNSNQKIFFINSIDDTSDLVGTTVTPTGCTAATSDWGIGGRMSGNPFVGGSITGALRAGDTVIINQTLATRTTSYFTCVTAGDSTTGPITLTGKVGVRPVLELTSGNATTLACSQANWYISNLEFKSDGATSSAVVTAGATGVTLDNIKVSQSNGAAGILATGGGVSVLNSEVTGGVTGDGISVGAASVTVFGNNVHGVGGDCIEVTNANPTSMLVENTLSGCGGRGIFFSGASTTQAVAAIVASNTIYGATLAGMEVTDADSRIMLFNNIIMNTNSADIVKWTAGNAQLVSVHKNNLFFSSSTGVLNGLTANSTEVTSDPLFTNAGSSDFTLQSGSPAKATGYPGALLGGNTGFLDIGALQRQEAGGSGGHPPCIWC